MRIHYLMALLALVAVFAGVAYYAYQPLAESITLGLDIRGGITVLLEAVETEGTRIDDDAMNRALAVLTNRVNGLGVAEPEIYREGARRIRVSLPGFADQERAREILGRTALLEFRDADGEVFLSGANLKDARERIDTQTGGASVSMTFDDEGGRKMRDFTSANVGNFLVITLDGTPIQIATIREAVGAEGSISGIATLEEARNLAIMLRSGALPVSLRIQDFRAVGPSLGRISLERSMRAGIIGIILVLLFMLVFYRLFGLLANIALVVYAFVTLGLMAALGATLTLPGIAGLILGVGMAVDANIIIFERIKDEVRTGRTLRSAIAAGFKRAILTVMDANITTLIAAGVLYYFGTGPIRGFAVTLALSIVVSMLTAIIVTRMLINLLVNANLTKSTSILGVGGATK